MSRDYETDRSVRAFSLVEVVMALAIFSFVAVALVGLISVGITTNQDSIEELEATNLIQSFFGKRRGSPLAPEIGNCPLPRLDIASETDSSLPLYVREDGSLSEDSGEARFGMFYRVSPPDATRRYSTAYVCLFWPPQARAGQTKGHHEMTGSFLLP